MLKVCYTGVSLAEAIMQLQAEGDDKAYFRCDKWSEELNNK